MKQKITKPPAFLWISGIYISVLLLISAIACYFSYTQRKSDILSNMEITFMQLDQDYKNTLDNFWQIYMPIYEKNNEVHNILGNYFTKDFTDKLSPIEKYDLTNALKQMLIRDNQAQWIALYSDNRDINYILFNTNSALQEISADFPYLEDMNSKSTQMEIYGMHPLVNGSTPLETYAICGGVPFNMGSGKIIAGYSISALDQICQSSKSPLKTLEFILTTNDQVLYHSEGVYSAEKFYLPKDPYTGLYTSTDDVSMYLHSEVCGTKTSMLRYQFSNWELFIYSHRNTPAILLIVLVFGLFSIYTYTLMLKQVSKEVNIIRKGLGEISKNQLTYQISTDLKQNGLHEIAESINLMANRLNENINRAYYYELRQKEAELSELQSKFNPHFLYNSLEMIRSRCFQSGDEATAELITQLSSIFRGFIGSRNFISLHEELAFSKRYLALFGARYKDQVQIRYDIDTELLQYGIIRNVFQPLIENYFVHGFDTTPAEENYICFRGKSFDEQTMILTVEDNGSGMTYSELECLNLTLQEPITIDTESYGLKNLHQRLRLFYGNDCGLYIMSNKDKGLSIQMKVMKMTLEEYQNTRQMRNN